MLHGYSDRINHALAFAAKHNDREVRKGMRLPYGTHGANIAVILTKYNQDETTIVAGILQNVIADCVRDRFTPEMLTQRIGDKFGADSLDIALAVTMRRNDDDGVELSHDEQRDDYLERLKAASDEARWVCAADAVHTASTIQADLKRTIDPDSVWGRFHWGKSGTIRWYRRLYDRLYDQGFRTPIMDELASVAEALERHGEEQGTSIKI